MRARTLARTVTAAVLLGCESSRPPAAPTLDLTVLPAQAARIFVINSTGDESDPNVGVPGMDDGVCDVDLGVSGAQCTLRAAIENAIETTRDAEFSFDLGTGTPTIQVGSSGLGPLPPLLGRVVIDGKTGGADLVELDGGMAGPGANGLELRGGDSEISNMVINSFDGHGILISGTPPPGEGGHRIEGNFIGTYQDGATPKPNGGAGIFIEDTPDNTIGGTDGIASCTGACNLISGNGGPGIHILGRDPEETGSPTSGAPNNRVLGNYIGVDLTGEIDLGNGGDGVFIEGGARDNIIGGTTEAARNIVSGNDGNGIHIEGRPVAALGATGNMILGNFVGTDVRGETRVGNEGYGVVLQSESRSMVGDLTASPGTPPGNLISGNKLDGVGIFGPGADSNMVLGNIIGLNARGDAALANRIGVHIQRGNDNTVGGRTRRARNVVSGNLNAGVEISVMATGNRVWGNFIGTDAAGRSALGNFHGVRVIDASTNLVGESVDGNPGDPPGNVISGNSLQGVQILILLGAAAGNRVQGNIIGLNAKGTAKVGNRASGVLIAGAPENIIGGMAAAARNIISGNVADGIGISGRGAQRNRVLTNTIGLTLEGAAEGNGEHGVAIANGAGHNEVKESAIRFNNGAGVRILDTAGPHNKTTDPNSISSNGGLGIDLGPEGVTPNDPGDTDDVQNFPELTSVTSSGGTTTLLGLLDSRPNTTFTLEFFGNTECDPSGFGEGETFLGSQQVTTDGQGDAVFAVTLSASAANVTATATATDPNGSTSEFSRCVQVAATPDEAIRGLIAQVRALGLPRGLENSLLVKLEAARASLNRANSTAAINQLLAFVNQVMAQSGKKIPAAQAAGLVSAALQIIDMLSASPMR
jgi:CSLREA domain-containing protein